MWNNIKHSLIGQMRLLFVISLVVILSLWGFFYLRQKHLQEEHDTARYFSVASSLQPLLLQSLLPSDDALHEYNMQLFKSTLSQNAKKVYHRGDERKGFTLFEEDRRRILYVYNPIGSVYLEDLEEDYTLELIQTIFLALMVIQAILFAVSQKLFRPILEMEQKLKNLQKGDRSKLTVDSPYQEIVQIKDAYNRAIDYINYLLQTREMFNKIFMHELKTPLAKGMFYLKNEPSDQSHSDIQKVFDTINTQLDTFRTLEELIAYHGNVSKERHCVQTLLDNAVQTLHVKSSETVQAQGCKKGFIQGDSVLWEICFKNIIDNALRYSTNRHVDITCQEGNILFSNEGEPLPLDISQPLRDWKIDHVKKHRSSSGYGFGLFIIKNIVELHGYTLEYYYENHRLSLAIHP
ncbi:MAG: ATP-binding protein [Sulfurospirillaceae bacterium]|nr:ATP-binding protein [Sulfurospirillaceae bacterium]